MKLNNGLEIPQIGVGTWTLRGETARQNVQLASVLNSGDTVDWPHHRHLSRQQLDDCGQRGRAGREPEH